MFFVVAYEKYKIETQIVQEDFMEYVDALCILFIRHIVIQK
jgi:hypothetical protein